jgi:hypothetical protein
MDKYKHCGRCDATKHFRDFYKDKNKANGLASHCKECQRSNLALYNRRVVRRTTYEERFLTKVRLRALKLGIPFDLTPVDICIPKRCPVLGIPLIRDATMINREQTPSLDKIKPELGYVCGNVVVISWLANRIRNNGTWDQHQKIADFYRPLEV